MTLRRRSDEQTTRGQALVEFAIILPLLALLLVMALDFGRIFFGWIGLQNGARVAADFAAANAESWPDENLLYQKLVINDMQAINCAPAPGDDDNGNGQWDEGEVPEPVFTDMRDTNVETRDDGDHAVVVLDCEFDVLTPLASSIVGSPVELRAEAYFPIHRILRATIPTPEPTPPGPCPAPTALFDLTENPASGPGANPTDGRGGPDVLVVDFTNTSTDDPDCPITSYSWDFGGATVTPATSTDESPTGVTFNHPTGSNPHKTFTVVLTVETDDGVQSTATDTIRVDP